jgi:hypothetical protein
MYRRLNIGTEQTAKRASITAKIHLKRRNSKITIQTLQRKPNTAGCSSLAKIDRHRVKGDTLAEHQPRQQHNRDLKAASNNIGSCCEASGGSLPDRPKSPATVESHHQAGRHRVSSAEAEGFFTPSRIVQRV